MNFLLVLYPPLDITHSPSDHTEKLYEPWSKLQINFK